MNSTIEKSRLVMLSLALSSVRGKQPQTAAVDEEALQAHMGDGSDPELD